MKTIIGSRIRIEEPLPEVEAWAKEHLEFDNPEYVKKERMGFWLGRTPKKLRMYEWRGGSLVVPFGVLKELWPMLKEQSVECRFGAVPTVAYGEPVPLYDYQRVAVQEMIRARYGILKSTTGSGKGLPLNAKIYTPDGYTRNGDLQIGDEVLNSYGGISKVTGIYDRGKQVCYKITFTDDTSVVCDKDHLWNVVDHQATTNKWQTLNTEALFQLGTQRSCGCGCRWEIPVTQPVQFAPRKVIIEPWLLGVLLGDGTFTKQEVSVSNTEEDILKRVQQIANCKVHHRKDRVSMILCDRGSLHYRLMDYGLQGCHSWEKFIPKDYIYNSVDVRLKVLQGLIDADGSIDGTTVSITSTSRRLMEDCLEIVQSLGGTGRISTRTTNYTYNGEKKEGRESYRLHLKLYLFEPFTSDKHKANAEQRTKYTHAYRRIKDIKITTPRETRCIAVDSDDSLYLTDGFVVTHNTQMGIAMIKALSKPALWLCHTADLLKQSRDRALQYMDAGLTGTITEGKVNIGTGVTFATVQTMANLDLELYRDLWGVIIVDECFPEYTVITTKNGYKQIKDIAVGDVVLTRSNSGALEYKKVTTVFKKHPQSLVDIVLKDGTGLFCTDNHPILTEGGYKKANALTNNDSVYRVREAGRYISTESTKAEQHNSWEKARFLFQRMRDKSRECMDRRAQEKVIGTDDKIEQRKIIRTNEKKESFQESGNAGKDIRVSKTNGAQASRPWWKRFRSICSATSNGKCSEKTDSFDGICGSNKSSERKWISNKLQTGHRYSGNETWNRSGWKFTLSNQKAGTRSEERFTSCYTGVDRVEIQKQTSDGTYGGLCPDGYVYNIEVEGNHNYFANGVNVHNCHRVASSATTFTRYERVLNNLSAPHKYGLSATVARSDGLIEATFALMGKVAYEVPEEAVADKVMDVKIRPVETETEITPACLNPDGTINYVKLIEHLTTDEERNKLITRCIMDEKDHSCIILSDRLEQLKAIRAMLPYEMQEDSVYIDGKMQSKKAKAEREQALEDMRSSKKKYLFASVSLCKEGLDIPRLDRLFFASPVKFSAIVIQAVGRVRRVFEGKGTPIVYDFVDKEIGFCERAYKERCRSYRKIGAEIEKGFLR